MKGDVQGVFTQDEMVDSARLGGTPSDDYMRVVEMLDNVVRECMYVSRSYGGIPSPSTKHYYASVLFTALVTKGVTLAQLMPFTPWVEKKIEHWDYASTAGLVRTMLELRIAFYYLCSDECDEAEWECRWNILNLHDCVARIRMFTAIENNEEVVRLSHTAEEIRDRLRANIFFDALPDKKKKTALHGQSAYLYPLEDIAEKAGVEKTQFRWLYVLLSSHVHALPMSFFRIGEERGRGLPTPVEEGYTSICLSLASTFLVKTRDEVHDLFQAFKAQADEIIERESREANEALSDLDNNVKIALAEGMFVGERRELYTSDVITIEVTLVQEGKLEVRYRDVRTGAVVLQSTESESGTYLELYDLYFWAVIVNGEHVTNDQMAFLEEDNFAFRADVQSRTLYFKHG